MIKMGTVQSHVHLTHRPTLGPQTSQHLDLQITLKTNQFGTKMNIIYSQTQVKHQPALCLSH